MVWEQISRDFLESLIWLQAGSLAPLCLYLGGLTGQEFTEACEAGDDCLSLMVTHLFLRMDVPRKS